MRLVLSLAKKIPPETSGLTPYTNSGSRAEDLLSKDDDPGTTPGPWGLLASCTWVFWAGLVGARGDAIGTTTLMAYSVRWYLFNAGSCYFSFLLAGINMFGRFEVTRARSYRTKQLSYDYLCIYY